MVNFHLTSGETVKVKSVTKILRNFSPFSVRKKSVKFYMKELQDHLDQNIVLESFKLRHYIQLIFDGVVFVQWHQFFLEQKKRFSHRLNIKHFFSFVITVFPFFLPSYFLAPHYNRNRVEVIFGHFSSWCRTWMGVRACRCRCRCAPRARRTSKSIPTPG